MKKTLLLGLCLAALNVLPFAQAGLTNELIWNSQEFSQEFVGGLNSMNDGLHYTSIEQSDAFGNLLVKNSYATGLPVDTLTSSKEIFADHATVIAGYEFSSDEKQLLVQTETESIYRHSFRANYYVFNLETRKTIPLADFSKGKQMLADFSPDGKRIAFVRDNNLFVLDTESGKEIQVTKDGENNRIINGATDWVYEEEFAIAKGFEWSPAGDRIAYYRFDESEVREFSMDMFGTDLYPTQYRFKYPKAGEKNSTIQIHVWDMKSGKSTMVNTGRGDIYIPRIKWAADNNKLCVMRMNRHQNKLEFLMADLSAAQPFQIDTKVFYTENADTYIDINDELTFLKDGSGFIWLTERDGYNHIWKFDMSGNPMACFTKGDWDVIDFYGYDETTSTAYFSSTLVKKAGVEKTRPGLSKGPAMTTDDVSPLQKHIYSATWGKKGVMFARLNTKNGVNDAEFSKGFRNVILTHTDAGSPAHISLHTGTGKLIRVLKDNKALRDKISQYKFTKKEFFTFKNSGGTELNCWMMKPGNFDPAKKYPVLVAIYGGPGSNTVSDSWGGRNFLWHQLLCQEGYIVVSCDPRGTMNRGRAFKHLTYMNLGKLETEDFIDLAKYLGSQTYVDKNRIGIQGWSYGGYMTALCMTKGADYYKAGISIAPVTNWKYYDTIYTERFLRTPQENDGGYENNSPVNFVDALKGKLLLVHGSADDNVHYQNTMDMVTALVKANKQFDLFVYPDKNHSIAGGNTRLHLYTMMTDFLKANL